MLVNVVTGEVIDRLSEMTDDQLAEILPELEEAHAKARDTLYAARAAMRERMERDGSTLRLTPNHKLRLRTSTRVKADKESKKLLGRLADEVPSDELKKKAFKTEITATVSGLREIAKLGDEWRQKVELLLDEGKVVIVEPRLDGEEPKPEVEQAHVDPEAQEVPW